MCVLTTDELTGWPCLLPLRISERLLTPVTHHLVFSSSDVLTLNRVFFSEK